MHHGCKYSENEACMQAKCDIYVLLEKIRLSGTNKV